MKPLHFLFLTLLFYATSIKSQTVIVSGECMTGSITLNPVGTVNGKIAYSGLGTVDGNANVNVNVYWLPAPDNLWVLDFDGQPYFQNPCDSTLPWGTGNGACPWTAVDGQTCTGAAPLYLRGEGALLVQLTSFTARADNKEVILNWKTATETNNKGFEIQRSADGATWSNIGFVNGSVNSGTERSYRFNDLNPIGGKGFYMLRQVDLDGRYSFSRVVSVNFLKSGFYSISNNPGNGLYNLHLEAGTEKIEFSVIDAGGRQILNKINNSAGDQVIDLTNFSPGVYFLRIIKGTDLFTEKLVKF